MTDHLEMSRVSRSREEARSSYDRLSRYYDLLAGASEKRLVQTGLRKLDARPGETVLEIGFGTGRALLAVARAVGEAGKVYGIDISRGMLDVAQARVEQAQLSHRVELGCADAVSLPFAPQFFDAIFMTFTLELFDTPEMPIVLRECDRVLRNDGRICVVAMSKGEHAGWAERVYEWLHRKFPTLVDCRPIFVRRVLTDAGFQVVEVTQARTWRLPVEIVLARKAQPARTDKIPEPPL